MYTSSGIIISLFFAATLGLLYLIRARAMEGESLDDTPLDHMLHNLEMGICPRCEAVHPEAATHADSRGFWTNFRCPECDYTMSAHINHRHDIDE